MSAELIFAILVAVASLGFALERVSSQLKAAQRRARMLVAKKNQQVERIKRVALSSLRLKRELHQNQKTIRAMSAEITRLETQLAEMTDPNNRIFVLDERRTPQDDSWLVAVIAPPRPEGPVRATWKGVRRFLVWAHGAEQAQQKAARRFPAASGFQIGEIVALPKPRPTSTKRAAG